MKSFKLSSEGNFRFIQGTRLLKYDYEVNNKFTFGEAVPAAVKESWSLLVYNVKQFKLILRPKTEALQTRSKPYRNRTSFARYLELGVHLELHRLVLNRISLYELVANTWFRWWTRFVYYS